MRLAATISFELMHVAPPLRNFLAALPEVSIDLYLSDGQCQDVETDEISWQPVQTGSNAINRIARKSEPSTPPEFVCTGWFAEDYLIWVEPLLEDLTRLGRAHDFKQAMRPPRGGDLGTTHALEGAQNRERHASESRWLGASAAEMLGRPKYKLGDRQRIWALRKAAPLHYGETDRECGGTHEPAGI